MNKLLALSFLSLLCNAAAADGHDTDKKSKRVAIQIDAKGATANAQDAVHRTDNLAKHDVNNAVEHKVSEKDIKAHVAQEQVESKSDKANTTIVRAQASDQQRSWFAETVFSWEQRLFAWKHNIVEKAEDKSISLWARAKSNETLEFPHELFPAEFLRTYCYEMDSDCWSKKAKEVAACKSVNEHFAEDVPCRCSEHGDDLCNVNSLAQTMSATGRCVDLKVYVNKAGKQEEVHCGKMVKNTEWMQKGLVAQSHDGPESTKMPWYKWCGFSHVSKDGECKRKVRFLTESCWGSSGHGACAGSDLGNGQFSTACYKGKCLPYSFAFAQPNVQCSCSMTGWLFPFACSAANDQCGGHPCVWNEKRSNMNCDFMEKQNWNDATHIVLPIVVVGIALAISVAIGSMAWFLMPSEVKASILYQLGMTKLI